MVEKEEFSNQHEEMYRKAALRESLWMSSNKMLSNILHNPSIDMLDFPLKLWTGSNQSPRVLTLKAMIL